MLTSKIKKCIICSDPLAEYPILNLIQCKNKNNHSFQFNIKDDNVFAYNIIYPNESNLYYYLYSNGMYNKRTIVRYVIFDNIQQIFLRPKLHPNPLFFNNSFFPIPKSFDETKNLVSRLIKLSYLS